MECCESSRHSSSVVSKDSKGEGEGETVSGRRTEGKGKVEKGVSTCNMVFDTFLRGALYLYDEIFVFVKSVGN